jgi:hypothetical protein
VSQQACCILTLLPSIRGRLQWPCIAPTRRYLVTTRRYLFLLRQREREAQEERLAAQQNRQLFLEAKARDKQKVAGAAAGAPAAGGP